MDKILQFDKSKDRYIKLADIRQQEGDLEGALSLLFTAQKICPAHEVYSRIAYLYSQMDLLDLSNKYWYKFMFVAPSDVITTCYEELAINYFYLDNLWASGYYMHKKLSIDGYISREDIDKEVMDFFTGEEIKKYSYRIVYPHDIANYSFELKSAKRALRAGGFKDAIESLEKIPKPCHTNDSMSDLSLAYLMNDDFENAESVCRQSIESFGESVEAYCNLSTIYDMKEDDDKAEYYYQKALQLRTDSQDEPYKIATCAIERHDHEMAKRCLEKILQDRPYELPMRFFYAISLLNLNKYDLAVKELLTVYKQDPSDIITQYYLELAKKFQNKECSEKILPLKYMKELPSKEVVSWTKKINELVKAPQNLANELKKKQVNNMLLWGLEYGNEQTVKTSAMLLSTKSAKKFSEVALEILLDPNSELDTKRLLLCALILKGYKGKIGVVLGSYYCDFIQKTMLCEKDKDGGLYFSAYALCVSRMAFYAVENIGKIAKSANKVYKKLHTQITNAEVNNEELAGLILLQCGFENLNTVQNVCKIFEVEQKKLTLLNKMMD